MIDVTCCFANNLNEETNSPLSEHSANILANEFETAVSDGYIRFLIALTNEQDIAIAKTLLETKNTLENTKIKIEVVVEKSLLLTGKDKKGNNGEYIKNCMVNFDSILVYDANAEAKFYSVNHYLLYYSTRVVLLYDNDNIDAPDENDLQDDDKEIDDFFVAHMLYKDTKKLFL